MKKKFFILLLTLVAALSLALFAACTSGGENVSGGSAGGSSVSASSASGSDSTGGQNKPSIDLPANPFKA